MKNISYKSSLALALSSAFLLSACAPMGKQHSLDHAITADTLALPAGQTAVVQANWWQQLNQPVLNQLITSALSKAPDLRIAQARLNEAEALWQGAEGKAGIQLGIQASGNAIYIDPAPAIPMKDTNHILQNGMVAAAVNYTFDFWGKQNNIIREALGQKIAAQWQVSQAQLVITQAIVSQYTQWQLLNAQLDIIANRITINQQIHRLLSNQVRTGLLPASAVYVQEQVVLALQAAQQQLLAERERTVHSLAILTGQSPTIINAQTKVQFGQLPSLAVSTLHADILGQRPDIAAQRALLQSRYYGIQAAKAEFYPNIELKGLAGLSHMDAFDVLRSTSRLLGLMPAITLPIFTSGQLQANLAGKQAQYNEQVALYDKTVLTALQQAADAITDYQHSQGAVIQQKQAWQLAQKTANASVARQKAGLENGLTRLQHEDAALSAQSSYWQAFAWQQHSWNNLQTALGGGFQSTQK